MFFFFNETATTEIYPDGHTLALHDALPIYDAQIPALDYAFQTLPAGVEMYSLRGPLFFGAARSLRDALEAMPTPPRVFILRMRNVPMIDSSGVAALSDFKIGRAHV